MRNRLSSRPWDSHAVLTTACDGCDAERCDGVTDVTEVGTAAWLPHHPPCSVQHKYYRRPVEQV